MASAASGQSIASTPTAGTQIFDADSDGGPCVAFKVRCQAGSSNDLLVRVDNIHKAGEFALVPIGSDEVFRVGVARGGISAVFAKGSGGTATADYHIVAKHT